MTALPLPGRQEVTLRLRLPRLGPSLNRRMHWAERARVTKQIREASALQARSEMNRLGLTTAEGPVVLTMHVVRSLQARDVDPDNIHGTVKPCLDGCVDAGLLPDDGPRWVTALTVSQERRRGTVGVILEVTLS